MKWIVAFFISEQILLFSSLYFRFVIIKNVMNVLTRGVP